MRSLPLFVFLCLVALVPAAAAAPAQSGSVSAGSPVFKWNGGPISGVNLIGEPCGPSRQCEDILLAVGDRGSLEISWKADSPTGQAALNFELYKSDAEGNVEGDEPVADGGSFGSEGALKAFVEARHYVIRASALESAAATYEGEAALKAGAEDDAEYGEEPADASAADWYKQAGAQWFQAYIDEADGTRLHVDVLRPEGMPLDQKTPVILSIGPYFNHTGQVGAAGPVQDATYDPFASPGPSNRFADFVLGADIIRKGYTFVMVDLRGFGGSTGCLDWVGPGEQADVVAAVEWAASQQWSTGKVGMYGKSYDGVTGLVGEVLNPKGLAAVVAQEPVYDMYRYLYAEGGLRFHNSLATPALYDAIALTPGSVQDEPGYVVGSVDSTARPGCDAANWADQQDSNHDSEYWNARNFIKMAKNGKTPLFLTQGFLENNTKPDGTWDFFNAVKAPKRAWFGMWDHVRGQDVDKDNKNRLLMGRKGFNAEVMRFYDKWLKGDEPAVKDPTLAVQSNDGKWRAEEQWPPPDSKSTPIPLKTGEYVDDANTRASNDGVAIKGDATGIWSISKPLKYGAHLAGVPRLKFEVETSAPNANFAVAVYDIDKELRATLVHRNGRLLPESGKYTLDLYGNDWQIPKGNRVGILLSTSHSEWWLGAVPTNSTVTVKSATLDLPYLRYFRNERIDGKSAVRLENYLANTPITLDEELVKSNTLASFPMPPKMQARPSGTTKSARLTAKIKKAKRGKRIVVRGKAPKGSRVKVQLRRAGKVVKTKRVKAKKGRYVARFKIKKAGRYRAVVRTKKSGRKLKKRTKTVRVKRR